MSFLFRRRETAVAVAAEPIHATFPQIAGAEMAAVYFAQRMGGDFYDSIRVGADRILFVLLDVAGRHDDNREILIATQETFRTRGAQLFAGTDINESEAMTQLCQDLNRTVIRTAGGVRACPAFVGCYRETLGTICYCDAGHTAGLLRDHSGTAELGATGLPLGLFSHSTCDAPTVALEPGAALVLVSRGIVDATCKGLDEEFGLERVKQQMQRADSHSAQELAASMVKAVGDFMCAPPLHDDVTALVLSRSS